MAPIHDLQAIFKTSITVQEKNLRILFQKQQPNFEQSLYRYVTIEKLIDFILNKRIPLTRLDLFDDKLEGINTTHALLNLGGNKLSQEFFPWLGDTFKHFTANAFPMKRNSLRLQKEIFQKTNFASCWHASKFESIAMWQIYSNPNSVAIRIPYTSIKEEIENRRFNIDLNIVENIKLGSVDYHHFNDLDDISEAVVKECVVGFLKDASFQYENEFRIISEAIDFRKVKLERNDIMLDEQINKMNSERNIRVIYLTFDCFEKMNFELLFHPKSPKWHRQNIVKLIELASLNFKCIESNLKDNFE